jgi:hypothetical protein
MQKFNTKTEKQRRCITIKSRKISLILAFILLAWFTLDMTGLSFGKVEIVTSAFVDEPIDALFLIIYAGSVLLYAFKEKFGRRMFSIVLLFWAFIQGRMYVGSGEMIASYNDYFSGTHRILPPSDVFLIKDTYHLALDFLILANIVLLIFHFVCLKISKQQEATTKN